VRNLRALQQVIATIFQEHDGNKNRIDSTANSIKRTIPSGDTRRLSSLSEHDRTRSLTDNRIVDN